MASPWEGIASPADGNASAVIASPWDGVASPAEAPVVEKSWGEKALDFVPHQTGIISNAVVKGATAIPTLISNIPAAAGNTVAYGYNKLAGGHADYVPLNNPFGVGADVIFGPNGQPQGPGERIESGIVSGLAGVGSGVKIGKEAVEKGSELIGPKLGALLSARPAVQAQAAAGGAATGGAAKELGYGPKAQFIASLAGALAAPASWSAIKTAGAAVQPLLTSGQKQIAANFMRGSATDPNVAIQNIKNAPEYIPGSKPTAGVASGDYGLMDVERTLRQQPGNPFSQRIAEQNAARNATMNAVAGTPGDIATSEATRKAVTSPLYESAQNVPTAPDAFRPILSGIDSAVENAGKASDLGKTLLAYKAKIQGGLPSMEPVNTGLLDETGMPISRPNFETTTQGPLSQIYREERDQLQKAGMQPGAYASSVKGVVKPLNYQLGKALEAQSPDLEYANQEYQRMSTDINHMQNAQALTKSLTGTTKDAAGNYFYEPSRVERLVKAGGMNTENQGWKPLSVALDPNQQHYLGNLHADLGRDNLLNSPAVRPVGSNTFANFTSSGAINSKIGSMLEKIPVAGNIYKGASERIKQQLIAAYLDPKIAAQMLAKGKAPEDAMLHALMKNLAAGARASTLYSNQMPEPGK